MFYSFHIVSDISSLIFLSGEELTDCPPRNDQEFDSINRIYSLSSNSPATPKMIHVNQIFVPKKLKNGNKTCPVWHQQLVNNGKGGERDSGGEWQGWRGAGRWSRASQAGWTQRRNPECKSGTEKRSLYPAWAHTWEVRDRYSPSMPGLWQQDGSPADSPLAGTRILKNLVTTSAGAGWERADREKVLRVAKGEPYQ